MLSRKFPAGWDFDMLSFALGKGYSLFGLNMLQPSPKDWTVNMLMENQSTHNPNILDPLMASKVHIYIHGDSEEVVGFKLTDNIEMRRQ